MARAPTQKHLSEGFSEGGGRRKTSDIILFFTAHFLIDIKQ